MAVSIKEDWMTLTAAQNFTAADIGRVVNFSGTVTAITDAHVQAGVLRSVANSGESVSVAYRGIGKVQVGSAVNSLGAMLSTTVASGFLGAGAFALSIASISHARALATAASGDMVLASFNFARG